MRVLWILAVVACKSHEEPPKPVAPPPPEAAKPPQLELAKLGALPMQDLAGHPAKLADRMRDVTVIGFWASWCHPCLLELPQLDQLARENKDPRVGFVMVNLDEPAAHADAVKALEDKHVTAPVLFDPDAAAYALLFPEGGSDMISIPALAIVRNDRLAFRDNGFDDAPGAFAAELHREIDAALK